MNPSKIKGAAKGLRIQRRSAKFSWASCRQRRPSEKKNKNKSHRIFGKPKNRSPVWHFQNDPIIALCCFLKWVSSSFLFEKSIARNARKEAMALPASSPKHGLLEAMSRQEHHRFLSLFVPTCYHVSTRTDWGIPWKTLWFLLNYCWTHFKTHVKSLKGPLTPITKNPTKTTKTCVFTTRTTNFNLL